MQKEALFIQEDPAVITACRETQLGNTLYRVISVSEKGADWSRRIESLAVRRAVAERAVTEKPVAERTAAEPEQLPGALRDKGVWL